MPTPSIADLGAAAAVADEPGFIAPATTKFGGVDPLGLRQLNFDLMDEVFPGLNNVARHVRPFVVVAWAWRRAIQVAQSTGVPLVKKGELQDFVDRIEVLYVLSQSLRNKDVDLPGRQYLAPLLKEPEFVFSGAKWKKRREEREYSTALSAPVNYGPGLKMLGWVVPHQEFPGIMVPSSEATSALDSFEAVLEPALGHDAFGKLGAVTVAREDAADWSELWSLESVTEAEARVMRALLVGATAPVGRRLGGRLMLAAAAHADSRDTVVVRSAMTGAPAPFTPETELVDIRDAWRRLQVRQLFRLSLESLFYWMMLNLEGPPRPIDALVSDFLGQVGPHAEARAGDWISRLTSTDVGPVELMDRIELACKEDGRADLPSSIAAGLACALTEPDGKATRPQQVERLPISRAQKELAARADTSVFDFTRHVFESWVLAQHSYWSVGRGLADARAGGRTLLRLRIILDEGGWTLTPGAPVGGAPRPTPDRLETALILAAECGLL